MKAILKTNGKYNDVLFLFNDPRIAMEVAIASIPVESIGYGDGQRYELTKDYAPEIILLADNSSKLPAQDTALIAELERVNSEYSNVRSERYNLQNKVKELEEKLATINSAVNGEEEPKEE